MQRGAVIIGVNRTGNLPALQAAVSSAEAVARWAQGQQFAAVTLLTDNAQPVTIQQIKTAIKTLVDQATFDQLVVYFSGHGVNKNYGEYWLLSDAPVDTQAAVNVDGSVVLARQAGVPHVVFVSDACRTAAEGIQAQQVTGGEVFPNNPVGGPEKPVDFFFATTLGAAALEIKDPAVAVRRFKALYTDALIDALYGRATMCIEQGEDGGHPVGFVRPWPLRKYLEAEVPRRLAAAKIDLTVFQMPDARITSPPGTWLSRIVGAAPAAAAPAPPPPPGAPAPAPPPRVAPPALPALGPALGRIAAVWNAGVVAEANRATTTIVQTAQDRATPFGRAHFESRCGFKIRGSAFINAFHPTSLVYVDGPDSVRVDIGRPASVLLELQGGLGVILPAIPEFVTALTIEAGELVNVVYEPADTSWRWGDYQARLTEIRDLRGQIAAAAHFGVFRLEGPTAFEIARRMQVSKSFDPTMALYAAYAYNDLQQRDRIREMQEYLFADLQLRLFDIALLAGSLNQKAITAADQVFPPIPMLSQGWGLLSAFAMRLPPQLQSLSQSIRPSLWTLLDAAGVAALRGAFQAGEIV